MRRFLLDIGLRLGIVALSVCLAVGFTQYVLAAPSEGSLETNSIMYPLGKTYDKDNPGANEFMWQLTTITDSGGDFVDAGLRIHGYITAIEINNSSATAAVDITLTDEWGTDVLSGQGADVGATAVLRFPIVDLFVIAEFDGYNATSAIEHTMGPYPFYGGLTLKVDNGGDTKGVKFKIHGIGRCGYKP